MKQTVEVAAVQMVVQWLDPEANLRRMKEALETVSAAGPVDLVVFPELANSGYVKPRDSKEFAVFSKAYYGVSEKIPGPFTVALGELAARHGAYIICGLLETHPVIPGTLYNSAVLVAPSGQLVGLHRKPHIPNEEKHYFYPGNTTEVFATDLGNIGILICADNSFPEIARVLALKGAEIMVVCYARPTAGRDQSLYYSIAACRAYENNVFYVACNRVGVEDGQVFEGRSCICGPSGRFLARSEGEEPEIIRATLQADDLVKARLLFSRFRDRRPELYRLLAEPF